MIDKDIGKWNWLLAFGAVLGVISVFCCFIYFWIGHFSGIKDGMAYVGQYGDSFGVLNSLFSALGFAVLLITLLYQQKQIRLQSLRDNNEVKERRSLFNLNAWEDAKTKAMTLLADGNNDRTTWIRAARVIKLAAVLAEGVTVENHRHVMELKSLEYRNFFRSLLEAKSAAFFYGTDDSSVAVAEAAMASTIARDVQGRHVFGDSVLSESSIYAIVVAAEWPQDYQDPIEEKFPKDFEKLVFFYNGLREFLNHRRQWASHNGTLHRRSDNDVS